MARIPLSKHSTALSGLAALLLVTGCLPVPISGFQPIYPEATQNIFFGPGFPVDIQLDWAKVDSLQPTFRWEPVPGRAAPEGIFSTKKPFIAAAPERIRNVRYDLRIWRVVGIEPEDVVYERKGIEGTSHKIAEPFQPDTKYYWSVRARFDLDGKPRVSEWSMALVHGDHTRRTARRTGRIPPYGYYRFKTPSR